MQFVKQKVGIFYFFKLICVHVCMCICVCMWWGGMGIDVEDVNDDPLHWKERVIISLLDLLFQLNIF